MEKSNDALKTGSKNNQLDTLQSTENLLKELNNLHIELGKQSQSQSQSQSGGAKKKGSKKASKKGSKKASKKGSKKASKKGSKKASKKGSKKGSKSMKGGAIEELVGGRTAPPALLEGVKTNRTVQDKLGCKGGPGLISFVNQKLRIPAKKEVKDPTDYKVLNKKMLEIFEEYVSKHGKSKVADEVNKIGEQIRSKRSKK